MKLFYDPDISGDFHVLNEEESKHCSKVLRLKKNDEVFITDGKGNLYKTILEEIHQKKTILKIVETFSEFEKRPYKLHIAIAPTKNIIFEVILCPLLLFRYFADLVSASALKFWFSEFLTFTFRVAFNSSI